MLTWTYAVGDRIAVRRDLDPPRGRVKQMVDAATVTELALDGSTGELGYKVKKHSGWDVKNVSIFVPESAVEHVL